MLAFQYPFRPEEDYSSSLKLVYNSTRCSVPEITSLLQDTLSYKIEACPDGNLLPLSVFQQFFPNITRAQIERNLALSQYAVTVFLYKSQPL